jgi:hypothetical protein
MHNRVYDFTVVILLNGRGNLITSFANQLHDSMEVAFPCEDEQRFPSDECDIGCSQAECCP